MLLLQIPHHYRMAGRPFFDAEQHPIMGKINLPIEPRKAANQGGLRNESHCLALSDSKIHPGVGQIFEANDRSSCNTVFVL